MPTKNDLSLALTKRAALAATLALLALAACASTTTIQHGAKVPGKRWALLPIVNASDVARADEGSRAILETVLYARGIEKLVVAPRQQPGGLSLDERRRVDEAVAWALKEGLTVGITGSVNEWRYRPLDGLAAVGMSLTVLDLHDGRVLWTASGSRSGASGETVSGTAQRLLQELTGGLELEK